MLNERELITDEALEGGFKSDAGKSRVDLIPSDILLELGELYGMGAKKYADDNWKLGMNYRRVYGAMLRHAYKWNAGEEYDSVDKQPHLQSVIWCAIALRYYETRSQYAQFDDRNTIPVKAEDKGQL